MANLNNPHNHGSTPPPPPPIVLSCGSVKSSDATTVVSERGWELDPKYHLFIFMNFHLLHDGQKEEEKEKEKHVAPNFRTLKHGPHFGLGPLGPIPISRSSGP